LALKFSVAGMPKAVITFGNKVQTAGSFNADNSVGDDSPVRSAEGDDIPLFHFFGINCFHSNNTADIKSRTHAAAEDSVQPMPSYCRRSTSQAAMNQEKHYGSHNQDEAAKYKVPCPSRKSSSEPCKSSAPLDTLEGSALNSRRADHNMTLLNWDYC